MHSENIFNASIGLIYRLRIEFASIFTYQSLARNHLRHFWNPQRSILKIVILTNEIFDFKLHLLFMLTILYVFNYISMSRLVYIPISNQILISVISAPMNKLPTDKLNIWILSATVKTRIKTRLSFVLNYSI